MAEHRCKAKEDEKKLQEQHKIKEVASLWKPKNVSIIENDNNETAKRKYQAAEKNEKQTQIGANKAICFIYLQTTDHQRVN